MTYPPGSGGYPPPPEREPSPWSSPIVMVAIAAGVLIVVAGILAALLLIPGAGDDAQPAATSQTTQNTPTPTTETLTETVSEPATTTPETPTTPTPTVPRAQPNVANADWQGFLSEPRCNAADDPAIVIGESQRSKVVICQVGDNDGQWYYKGLADGNDIEIQFPTRSGDGYRASSGNTTYMLSPRGLSITSAGTRYPTEVWLAYWER